MASIRSKDTRPERAVRRIAHALGFRFRLHRKDLPGRPDLVFPRLRKVIFVHGCYWHHHTCPHGNMPKCRKGYWTKKLERNVQRDSANQLELKRLGWSVLVVWECELARTEAVSARIRKFLDEGTSE